MRIKADCGKLPSLSVGVQKLTLHSDTELEQEFITRLHKEINAKNVGYWVTILRRVQDEGYEIPEPKKKTKKR